MAAIRYVVESHRSLDVGNGATLSMFESSPSPAMNERRTRAVRRRRDGAKHRDGAKACPSSTRA
jgi:hypothetical protein